MSGERQQPRCAAEAPPGCRVGAAESLMGRQRDRNSNLKLCQESNEALRLTAPQVQKEKSSDTQRDVFDFRKRKAKVPVLCLTFDFNPRAQDTERTAILMLFLFYPQQVVVLLPVCRSHCLIHITKQNSHKRRNAH